MTNSGLAPAYRGRNEPKPLPFDPSKLKGLSEKLVSSHHQNNYGGAVSTIPARTRSTAIGPGITRRASPGECRCS